MQGPGGVVPLEAGNLVQASAVAPHGRSRAWRAVWGFESVDAPFGVLGHPDRSERDGDGAVREGGLVGRGRVGGDQRGEQRGDQVGGGTADPVAGEDPVVGSVDVDEDRVGAAGLGGLP
jgi:hypothetical protein